MLEEPLFFNDGTSVVFDYQLRYRQRGHGTKA
jgi:hypothetical protein